jgi:hypothetical protein
MKVHIKSANSDATIKNMISLCNVEFTLRFPCIISLLDFVHTLIKLVEGKDIFVCDFVEFFKLAQHEFYIIYFDLFGMFEDSTFNDSNAIRILTNASLPM